jgi:hypothetical protein
MGQGVFGARIGRRDDFQIAQLLAALIRSMNKTRFCGCVGLFHD